MIIRMALVSLPSKPIFTRLIISFRYLDRHRAVAQGAHSLCHEHRMVPSAGQTQQHPEGLAGFVLRIAGYESQRILQGGFACSCEAGSERTLPLWVAGAAADGLSQEIQRAP